MSYCVNCGVELEKSEKKCPLCGVDVINPAQPFDEKAPRPYPRRLDPITERINRRFVGAMITIALVFPALLCATINYSLDNRLTWSLYVMGALFTVWVMTVPYYWLRKRTLNRLFIPDVLALLLFLFLIAALQQDRSWYWPVAVPLILIPSALVYLNIYLTIHRVIRGFVIPAAVLISAGILVTAIELILKAHGGNMRLDWSLYALIPCLAIAMVLLVIARKQSIHDEIKRRLHL